MLLVIKLVIKDFLIFSKTFFFRVRKPCAGTSFSEERKKQTGDYTEKQEEAELIQHGILKCLCVCVFRRNLIETFLR